MTNQESRKNRKIDIMKNQISAEIIADSKNELGNRITTFVLTFPRHILAELNTHRIFSRNSASSRAVPFSKPDTRTGMLERVEDDPFIPIAWQKNHKAMQGTRYHEDAFRIQEIRKLWLEARDRAVVAAKELADLDVTKQSVNRLLEPYMWHKAIITATEYENFFYLRCPQYKVREDLNQSYRSRKDYIEAYGSEELDQVDDLFWHKRNAGAGEIHIMRLAECMWDAMNESRPKQLKAGEWHIPFGDRIDAEKLIHVEPASFEKMTVEIDEFRKNKTAAKAKIEELKIKIATARCARVSYINYEGKDDYEADIKLYDRLSSMGHWSPMEHCAKAMSPKEYEGHLQINPVKFPSWSDQVKGWSGNFKGFVQLRKTMTGENIFHECLAHKKNSSYV